MSEQRELFSRRAALGLKFRVSVSQSFTRFCICCPSRPSLTLVALFGNYSNFQLYLMAFQRSKFCSKNKAEILPTTTIPPSLKSGRYDFSNYQRGRTVPGPFTQPTTSLRNSFTVQRAHVAQLGSGCLARIPNHLSPQRRLRF